MQEKLVSRAKELLSDGTVVRVFFSWLEKR